MNAQQQQKLPPSQLQQSLSQTSTHSRRPSTDSLARSTSTGGRRTSKTGGVASNSSSVIAASTSASTPVTTKPPTAAEARLAAQAPLFGPRIQDLVRQLDPAYTIDAQAEEQVLQLADDFLDKVCKQSFRIAVHRGSKTLDVQGKCFVFYDVKLDCDFALNRIQPQWRFNRFFFLLYFTFQMCNWFWRSSGALSFLDSARPCPKSPKWSLRQPQRRAPLLPLQLNQRAVVPNAAPVGAARVDNRRPKKPIRRGT